MDIQCTQGCAAAKTSYDWEFRNLECVSDLLSFPRDIPSPKTRTSARHILSTSKLEDEII